VGGGGGGGWGGGKENSPPLHQPSLNSTTKYSHTVMGGAAISQYLIVRGSVCWIWLAGSVIKTKKLKSLEISMELR